MEDVLPDVEPAVRQALMEQVPAVTKFFIDTGNDAGYTIVLHILLPMVAELTTDRNPQVSPFHRCVLTSFSLIFLFKGASRCC